MASMTGDEDNSPSTAEDSGSSSLASTDKTPVEEPLEDEQNNEDTEKPTTSKKRTDDTRTYTTRSKSDKTTIASLVFSTLVVCRKS